MNLLEIIQATLADMDRGTDGATVADYRQKFTAYANEACQEIARRFQACRAELTVLDDEHSFSVRDLTRGCLRVTHVYGTRRKGGGVVPDKRKEYGFDQAIHGGPLMEVLQGKAGEAVFVEYRFSPRPMKELTDSPDLPEYQHELIPLYVRAREQCGQDPSTQGTASAFFSLFNSKVRALERETMGTPESFRLKNYHFF